ncbi:methyltransferase family protein [Actinocorallia herbida]|uniref:Methyltransferase family protein n=1 Tax=Actinocorallia herbida TaxID=58109 RepID=A0A3N1CUN5_9ACTN|nr:methyltransferase domain-containing protein [Actinocorallia herbida]ROO84924.1 methyltransferase family protein [Actinocorallia herbida]
MTEHEKYTHGHHDSVLRSHRWRGVENSAAYLAPHLKPDDVLLDVGCGPGSITVDLASRVARVVGVDLAEGVLDEARARAEGVAHVSFQVGDVYALPFADGAFDVVHAHQTLQHVADPVAALREMRRVCRPGGIVAARDADYSGMFWYPASPELEEWLALYLKCARANGGEPDAGRHLLAWAHEAGFADAHPSASVWCHATPEERRWWGEMWRDRVVESAMADQALAAGYADRAGLERLSRAWQAFADHPDGWFTVPHGEILCRA